MPPQKRTLKKYMKGSTFLRSKKCWDNNFGSQNILCGQTFDGVVKFLGGKTKVGTKMLGVEGEQFRGWEVNNFGVQILWG